MKFSIVLCYNINKLTYLLRVSWPHLSLNWLYFHCPNVMYRDVHIDFYLATFYLNIPEVIGLLNEPGF